MFKLGHVTKALLSVLLFVAVFGLLSGVARAADSDATYKAFNDKLGSCPRTGQPARDECVLKLAKIYTDTYCAGKSNRASCNEEWRNGYLVWFSNQPNQDALRNKIGMTAIDTSNSSCKDRVGAQPTVCTQPYNTPDCKDRVGARPSYCDIPALSTDGSQAPTDSTDPTASLPEPECSSQVTDENARCEVAQQCDNGDLSEANCGITRYLKLFINTLSALVGIVVVAVLVIGGIQYSTSGGDPNAAAAAKKRISNAILALVAFGLMYGFLQWLVPGGVL